MIKLKKPIINVLTTDPLQTKGHVAEDKNCRERKGKSTWSN